MKLINVETGELLEVVGIDISQNCVTLKKYSSEKDQTGIITTDTIKVDSSNLDDLITNLLGTNQFENYKIYEGTYPWVTTDDTPEADEYNIRLYLTNDQLSYIVVNYYQMMDKIKNNYRVKLKEGVYVYLRSWEPQEKYLLENALSVTSQYK